MRRAPTVPGGPARAGFSLIELLIVIAILAALTGLALPAMQNWITRARFEETARQLPGLFAMVRADARRDGSPRRIIAWRDEAGRMQLASEVVERTRPAAEEPGAADAVASAPRRTPVAELPPGCELTEAGETAGEEPAGVEKSGAVTRDAPLTVVVYLPDGSAVSPARAVLRGPGGVHQSDLRFDRLTGRLRLVSRAAAVPMASDQASPGPAESAPAEGAP